MKAVLLAAHALAAGSSVISTDAVDASFRYEAAEATERRPAAPRTVGRREDRILTPPKRRAATDRSRDQARNFPLWQWAINTHLDYVTGFSFQSRSGDDGWDREFERYIEIESQPENFDAAGRLSRQEYMRMAEGLVLLDGDCLSLPLRDGTMQLIPAELIDNPPASERRDGDAWEQGVRVGPGGRPLAYGVHRYGRQGGRKEYDRVVSARRAIPLGHFTMPGQMRGITPLISSIAPAQDVRDGMRYALSKMQIAQMLGFVIVKKAIDNYDPEDTDDEADGETEGGGEGTEGETTETTESDAAAEEGRQFKLEHDRVFGAELEAGEDIRSFESKTPSNEFQSYTQVN
ncbi:MAG: phage portal protein, partial [Planctomycetota bacterium]